MYGFTAPVSPPGPASVWACEAVFAPFGAASGAGSGSLMVSSRSTAATPGSVAALSALSVGTFASTYPIWSYRWLTVAPRPARPSTTFLAEPFFAAMIIVTVGAFFASASSSNLASCAPSAFAAVGCEGCGAAGAALAVPAPPPTVRAPAARTEARSAADGRRLRVRGLLNVLFLQRTGPSRGRARVTVILRVRTTRVTTRPGFVISP